MTRKPRASRIAPALVAILVATVLAAPATALGATSLTATPLAGRGQPTAGVWQATDITFHPEGEGGGPVLLIAGMLKTSVKLPVTVGLSVPSGTQVGWTGEIFGGDPSKDIEASATVSTQPGYELVVFPLTKSRQGQTEVGYPQGVTSAGGVSTAQFSWTADQAYPTVRTAIRITPGSSVGTATLGAAVQKSGDGSSYFVKSYANVKKGQTLDLSVTYKPGVVAAAGSQTATGTAASGNTGLIVFIIIVIVLLLVAILVVQSRGSAAAAAAAKAAPAAKSAPSVKTTSTARGGKSGKSAPASKRGAGSKIARSAPPKAAPKTGPKQPDEPAGDVNDPFSQA
jgi:hypothetical protein